MTVVAVLTGPMIPSKKAAPAFARPVNQALAQMLMLALIPIMTVMPLTATLATATVQETVPSTLAENKQPALTVIIVMTAIYSVT